MAPTFTYKLGTLDLSPYCRMNPDDKFDPHGQPWLEPAFTETPYADGQPLISTTVNNREQQIPLFLNEPSKDLLHQLIQKINIAAGQRPLEVEWRDDSASASTFFPVAFFRFEPDFNFRRSQYGYAAGVLHVWEAGYGTTGTTRVAGTAAGTGIFLSVPIASIGGDGPALLDTTITAGAVLPSLGRIVAVAPITNPSYAPLVPAASLLELQSGATLVGASGAQGSQYLALPVSPTGGASGIACKIPLQNPTIMGGDNRVLAVVNSNIVSGVGIIALDPYGNAMGATAIASMSEAWGLVDLGVCRLPTVGFPTRPELSILAGGIWASGAEGPAIIASPGFDINEIIILPDKNLALVLESGVAPYSVDGFPESGLPLTQSADRSGNAWSPAYNLANALTYGTGMNIQAQAGIARFRQTVSALSSDAVHVAAAAHDTMTIGANFSFAVGPSGSREGRVFKDVKASQFVQARFSPTPAYLALEAATGAASGNTLASVALASLGALAHRLTLQTVGQQAYANLTSPFGAPIFAPGSLAAASVGVSNNAAVAGVGAPGFAIISASCAFEPVTVLAWEVSPVSTSTIQKFDSYRFDGLNADTYRVASSGVFSGQKLVGQQRGAFPKAAPSTSSVAVICAPFDQGVANDKISAVVNVRERFFYAR